MQNFDEEYYPREFEIGEIISMSWSFIKENFQPLLLIAIIVYVPINFLAAYISIDMLIPSLSENKFLASGNSQVLALLDLVFGIIATVAMINVLARRFQREEVDFIESLKFSLGIWHYSLLTMILFVVIIIALFVLLIIPGFIGLVYLSFTIYAVAMRGLWGTKALNYSYKLVSGRFWKTLGYLLVFGLLVAFIQMALYLPFMLLGEGPIVTFISNTLSSIVGIFSTVLVGMFFINMEDTHPRKHELDEILGYEAAENNEIENLEQDIKDNPEQDNKSGENSENQ